MNPTVSIVICTLNCRDYTQRCLESIRAQDYPQDKIEIVAPMRLKDHFRVQDGDQLTLEFFN